MKLFFNNRMFNHKNSYKKIKLRLRTIIFAFFIIPQTTFCRDIILVTFNTHIAKAKTIEKIIMEKAQIPSILISLKWKKSPCKKVQNAILQICISEKNEVFFPIINKTIILTSFKVFRK